MFYMMSQNGSEAEYNFCNLGTTLINEEKFWNLVSRTCMYGFQFRKEGEISKNHQWGKFKVCGENNFKFQNTLQTWMY